MKKAYVTESFSHFNTCKGNVVYLENVNFVFISRKKVHTLTTMEFISRKQLIFILDERSFNILALGQGICAKILLQGLLENLEFSIKLSWLLNIYPLEYFFVIFNSKSFLSHIFIFSFTMMQTLYFLMTEISFLNLIMNHICMIIHR